MLSATFHAVIIGVALLFALATDMRQETAPRVLELVAGEGDNYGATEAPKLGVEGGLKTDLSAALPDPIPIPNIPLPEPEPEPTPPTPEPPAPKPTPPAPQPKKEAPAPTPKNAPSISKKLLTQVYNAKAKVQREAAKERAAEQKRLAQMSKAEFDKLNKSGARGGSATKGARLDPEGIRSGVVGGSASNKTGGAGGKALSAAQAELIDQYYAMLTQRVLKALDKPPGVSDNLIVTIVGYSSLSGKISNVRVEESSGNAEFDHAVVVAFSRITMPERPDHKGEEFELKFRTKDAE